MCIAEYSGNFLYFNRLAQIYTSICVANRNPGTGDISCLKKTLKINGQVSTNKLSDQRWLKYVKWP